MAAALRSVRCPIPIAEALEDSLIAHGGRPHWGKYRYRTHDTSYRATYPNLARFDQVRRTLDPTGVFGQDGDMFSGLDRLERPPVRDMVKSIFDPDEYSDIRVL